MDDRPAQIASDLSRIVRGDVFADILHRVAYSTDASIYRIVPQCVVAPRDRDDVTAVVEYARARAIPIVARGAGTGLAGEALSAGIVLDMTRHMNRIIGVEGDGQTVICEPGAVLGHLNRYLAEFGRKIGPDPSSANRATVGGASPTISPAPTHSNTDTSPATSSLSKRSCRTQASSSSRTTANRSRLPMPELPR